MTIDFTNQPARRSIDGIRPSAASNAAASVAARPLPPMQQPMRRAYFHPPVTKKTRPLWEHVQIPLVLMLGLLGGYAAQSLALGLVILTIYTVIATIWRIPSRTTFMLALLFLAGIGILLFMKPDPQLAGNFASYAFLLLLLGVIHLGREARMPKRIRRSRRR